MKVSRSKITEILGGAEMISVDRQTDRWSD
jgi:hypothetical protein